jgi:hypothetical protein
VQIILCLVGVAFWLAGYCDIRLLHAVHVCHEGRFVQRLGIQHILTTAYHPQANIRVERVHRQIKDALLACAAGVAWHSHLPWVFLGLHAVPKEDSTFSWQR